MLTEISKTMRKKETRLKSMSLVLVLSIALASCAPVSSILGAINPSSNPAATPTVIVPVTGGNPAPQATTAASSSAKIPNFDHIILLVLENEDYSNVIGNSNMPHLNALAQQNVLLSNYFAVTHPSLPNYLALMSGSTQGITSDCTKCFVNQLNLADVIEASGRTWKAYLESMPSPCFIGDSGLYAQKHNPLLYFDSIRLDPNRCARSIVPLTTLSADLAANKLPSFSFIMANLCDSGHNCPVAKADTWVNNMVSQLQASPALGNNSLIMIVFDEGSTKSTASCCGMGASAGGQVAAVLISPTITRAPFVDNTAYSHYSLLKTILTAWNLPSLGQTQSADTPTIGAPWMGAQGSNSGSTQSPSGGLAVLTQPQACVSSSPTPATYSATICFNGPTMGSTLSGNVTVSAAATFTGSPTSIQRMIYYIDGNYVLTAFQNPYTFTLPTTQWVDGSHSISVEALMGGNFTTQRSTIQVNFNNGVTTVPVNSNHFQPATGTTPANGVPFTVVAGGDGAGGETYAGKVASLIASLNPNLFLYLGDVYENGSPTEFYNWYGTQNSFFSQLRSITNPTVGNHEYLTSGAAGYFNYWDNIPSYYSYNAGGWHFISLNSNGAFEPTTAQSAQYKWLQQDLTANPGACTIVYYHHPLFNIGPEGSAAEMSDIWKLMAQYNVTMVLNGHDHDYQRWVAMDGTGNPAPKGITEFVVGSAGHGLQTTIKTDSRVAYANDSNPAAFGALLLTLNHNGASFAYRNVDGLVLDSGVIPCVTAGADTQAPSVPTGLAANPNNKGGVNLTWSAASDNVGVAGYTVYRNGSAIVSVPGGSLSFTDISTAPSTTYAYAVDAFDQAGNHSGQSVSATINTSDVQASLDFNPEADTYVNATNPTKSYGKAASLHVDGAPVMHSYLRFTVSGLGGKTISKALLLLYVNTSAKDGFDVTAVADNSWGELTMNYNNAPALGRILVSSTKLAGGTWVQLDVTSYITGEGTYSFGISTTGPTAISIASKESGANAPKLSLILR